MTTRKSGVVATSIIGAAMSMIVSGGIEMVDCAANHQRLRLRHRMDSERGCLRSPRPTRIASSSARSSVDDYLKRLTDFTGVFQSHEVDRS